VAAHAPAGALADRSGEDALDAACDFLIYLAAFFGADFEAACWQKKPLDNARGSNDTPMAAGNNWVRSSTLQGATMLLIDQCMKEVNRVALLIVGESDEVVELVLDAMREEFKDKGDELPAEVVDLLLQAVLSRKSEIERGTTVSVRSH